MFLSFTEILHAAIMTFVVGWLFMDTTGVHRVRTPEEYVRAAKSRLDWNSFWFASLLVGSSILLHEFGHKIVAIAFGLDATFHAAFFWLVLAVIMKLALGFVFFVPAYVSISGFAPPGVYALTALAGPAVNFALYGFAKLMLAVSQERKRKLSAKERLFWTLSARINLFLGIFNCIPIPGFDGYQVLENLFQMFF